MGKLPVVALKSRGGQPPCGFNSRLGHLGKPFATMAYVNVRRPEPRAFLVVCEGQPEWGPLPSPPWRRFVLGCWGESHRAGGFAAAGPPLCRSSTCNTLWQPPILVRCLQDPSGGRADSGRSDRPGPSCVAEPLSKRLSGEDPRSSQCPRTGQLAPSHRRLEN